MYIKCDKGSRIGSELAVSKAKSGEVRRLRKRQLPACTRHERADDLDTCAGVACKKKRHGESAKDLECKIVCKAYDLARVPERAD